MTTINHNDLEFSLTGLENHCLHAVTSNAVLANSGKVFASQKGTTEDYELSQEVTAIDEFISHSWQDGRWSKWIALLFYLNFHTAVAMASVAAIVALAVQFVLFSHVFPASFDGVVMHVHLPITSRREWTIPAFSLTVEQTVLDINSTHVIYFPDENARGCNEWHHNDVCIKNGTACALALKYEGCSLAQKLQHLVRFLEMQKSEDANPCASMCDVILIYSDKLRSTLSRSVYTTTFSWPVVLIQQDMEAFSKWNGSSIRLTAPESGAWRQHRDTLLFQFRLRQDLTMVLMHIPPVVFFALLFLYHKCRRRMLYVDKLCIDQRSAFHVKEGLRSLPLCLQHSKRLVIVGTETYFTRLWCVYEIAKFLATHDFRHIFIQPMSYCVLVLISCCNAWIVVTITSLVFRSQDSSYILNIAIESQLFLFFLLWFSCTCVLSIFRYVAHTHHALTRQVQQFSIDNTYCSRLEDRVALVDDIQQWFTVTASHVSKPSEEKEGHIVEGLSPKQEHRTYGGGLPPQRAYGEGLSPKREYRTFADRLSPKREHRAFDRWMRTQILRDVHSFVRIGSTLGSRAIMYTILPLLWSLPFICVLDPFKSGLALYNSSFLCAVSTTSLCTVPLLYLLINHIFLSEPLNRLARSLECTFIIRRCTAMKERTGRKSDTYIVGNVILALLCVLVVVPLLITLAGYAFYRSDVAAQVFTAVACKLFTATCFWVSRRLEA